MIFDNYHLWIEQNGSSENIRGLKVFDHTRRILFVLTIKHNFASSTENALKFSDMRKHKNKVANKVYSKIKYDSKKKINYKR